MTNPRELMHKLFGKKFSVFLLEDNELFLTSLELSLKTAFDKEIEIMTFTNSDALCQNMSGCPDVVVMDFHLDENSKLEGLALIKRLKWSNPNTKIIVLTCEERFDIALQCYELGADNYVTKNIDAVKKVVQELVYKRDLVGK